MKGICFLGDGVVMGLGDTLPEGGQSGWPGRLAAAERQGGRPFLAFPLGVPGDTSGHLLNRWWGEADPRGAACEGNLGLVFSFGAEDMAEVVGEGIRVPIMESVQNAETLMSAARAAWPVLWVGPPPLGRPEGRVLNGDRWYRYSNARLRMANDAYRAIAERLFIPYLDLFDLFEGDIAWDWCQEGGDGVMPTAGGHALIAATVGRWPAWREWMDGLPRPARGLGTPVARIGGDGRSLAN